MATHDIMDNRNENLDDPLHHILVSTEAARFAILDPGRMP
jgi:hypothetical protein